MGSDNPLHGFKCPPDSSNVTIRRGRGRLNKKKKSLASVALMGNLDETNFRDIPVMTAIDRVLRATEPSKPVT